MKGRAHQGETSIKRAALINMTARYIAAFVGLAYSVVLARILSPEDFGVVAIAQVFVTFFALFQDMGLGSAIVQRQDLEEQDISQLFGFSSVLSLALGALLAIAGIPISSVYGEPRLTGICAALSLTVFFSTLNTVPNALLMKSKRFVAVGTRQIICVLAASALGVTSAALGAGPYAIVTYSVSNALLNLIWNWSTNRVAPEFHGMMNAVRKVFGYSAWLFGFNIVTYFTRNADNLLIGYFFGSADLGNYAKAYQLMQYPQTYLTGVVTSVLHPMLAEQQGDVDRVYEVFVRITKLLSLVAVPISVSCFFLSGEIVEFLYGNQWGLAADCLRWLSMSMWCQMVCGASGSMFQVLNKTKVQFARGVLIAVTVVGSIMVGVAVGRVEMVALGVGISYWIAFLLMLPFLVRMSFGKPILPFLKVFLPDLFLAAALAAILWGTGALLGGTPYLVAVDTILVCALYPPLLAITGQLRWIRPLIPKRFRKKKSASA